MKKFVKKFASVLAVVAAAVIVLFPSVYGSILAGYAVVYHLESDNVEIPENPTPLPTREIQEVSVSIAANQFAPPSELNQRLQMSLTAPTFVGPTRPSK